MFLSYVFNRYTALLLLLWFISRAFQAIDGLAAISNHLFSMEVLFILYLYAWFNLMLKQGRLQAWIAAIPIVLAYLTFDIFFVAYGRFFHLSEFQELPELLAVMPVLYSVVLALPVVLPLLLFFARIDYQRGRLIVLAGLPMFALIGTIGWQPQLFLQAYGALNKPVVSWSDGDHVLDNGRFMVFMHRQATRRLAMLSSRQHLNWTAYRQAVQAKVQQISAYEQPRNVHVLVLESFFEPNDLKAVRYDHDPAYSDYRALVGDKINYSSSPVFGGSTAQAEFEVLCGFPAFSLYSNVDFNAFGGANVSCLPGLLQQAGYRSLASNAFRPDFFNTLPAYKGIGFSEMYFASEFSKGKPTYFSNGHPEDEDFFMDDAALFAANLDLVEKHLKNSKQPLFNYILTIYGHFPHELHEGQVRHTKVMQAPYDDEFLKNAVNQYYYRTEAMSRYIRRLIEIDPDSLIVLIADHLPPMAYGQRSYQDMQYDKEIHQVPLLVVESGMVKSYPLLHHYDIPDLIQNYLSRGAHCQQQNCNLLSEQKIKAAYYADYQRFMAHALMTAP